MISDYDDDEHFCIKCHTAISGLDNYVAHRKSQQCTKPLAIPKSPLPSQLLAADEAFELKADDFFSSLELQSSTKKPPPVPPTIAVAPAAVSNRLGGILTRSKTTAVIEAATAAGQSKSGKNAWIGGHQLKELGSGDNQTKLIKAVDNLSRSAYVKKYEEEAPSTSTMVAGYESSGEESEDYEDYEEDEEEEDVPRNYTGGKWLPEWHTGGKSSSVPPPGHTKGKWKPPDAPVASGRPLRLIADESPPFRKSNGSVQYWCNPCNRLLSSKIVYERHLRSELHYKRLLAESFDDMPTTSMKAKSRKPKKSSPSVKKRCRKKLHMKCEVCQAKVTAQTMGKHLISHYHCRKSDLRKDLARKLILEHIHEIILQSPYQCGACRFYCNTHEEFLTHWRSICHAAVLRQNGGMLMCMFCKVSCEAQNNTEMYRHLVSSEHEEVISVINRSVPIVIRNLLPVRCVDCDASFLLNIQLREHCARSNHTLARTATDEYQAKKHCHVCGATCNSTTALQRHLKSHHDINMFFCSKCDARFDSAEGMREHRHTKEHHQVQRGLKPSTETTAEMKHACDQCEHFRAETLSEVLYHKSVVHGESTSGNGQVVHYKCPFCERHVRRAWLLFHLRNHTGEKLYGCEHCDAQFTRRSNLRYHQKKHEVKRDEVAVATTTRTIAEEEQHQQKDFLCSTCGAKFSKSGTLRKHMCVHAGKHFKCDHAGCVHAARTPADLRAHCRTTHTTERRFHCAHCDYRGKTKQQLKRHESIHDYGSAGGRKYKCSACEFTCRLLHQMRRHQRIHTGSKPFACPHCAHRCNNLENLRKHILVTNKHAGKHIFECKFCAGSGERERFAANYVNDFRVHLLAAHGDLFASAADATRYCTSVYTVDTTTTTSTTTTEIEEEEEQEEEEEEVIIEQQSELLPMYVIRAAKDVDVLEDKEEEVETWCMDVVEEGPTTALFEEHFQ